MERSMMQKVESRRTIFLLMVLFVSVCLVVYTWDENAILTTFRITEIPKYINNAPQYLRIDPSMSWFFESSNNMSSEDFPKPLINSTSSRFSPLFKTRNDSELLKCFGEDSGDKYLITWYNAPPWTRGEMAYLSKCAYKNCAIAYDRKCMRFSDAVMFWGVYAGSPPSKVPGQIWVFQSFESPQTIGAKFSGWKGLFNWTLTYRHDASIPCRWGHYTRRENTEIDLKSIYRNKTKSVLWMVSHCKTPSRREEYVKILQKYIDVDIYGNCGQLQCKGNGHYDKSDPCFVLFDKYKFYLSFENSLCDDYATEKAYNPLGKSTVPVVRGSSNYSSLLPPKSFINAADFKSIKDLAEYLKMVGNNETLYVKFLEWKRDNILEIVNPRLGKICKVCEMLNDKEKYAYVYEDFGNWWWKNGRACHEVKDLIVK